MGFFSWITSDTERSVSNIHSDRGAFPVYVLIPGEFGGGAIRESEYGGYGIFDGKDIYDLVAEWNRHCLPEDKPAMPKREQYGNDESGRAFYEMAHQRYLESVELLKDFASDKPDEYMEEKYGQDWKRSIGIMIACYDVDNASLKYPIKIVENKRLSYDEVSASKSCPDQGYFY